MRNRYLLSPFFLGERYAGLLPLAGEGWRFNDPKLESASPPETRIAVHEGLAQAVRGCIDRGERPVSLAGDCCTALGMLAGLRWTGIEPSLLWFDAHGDFNTPESSPSGFLGGMPLAILVGRGDPQLRRALGLAPFPEKCVLLTDGRELDEGERLLLEGSQVTHLRRIEELLKHPLPEGPLWVHFDADVVDASESPGHLFPAAGGPPVATVREVFLRIASTERLVAVSVSAWDPELDMTGASRRATMELLGTLVGDPSLA